MSVVALPFPAVIREALSKPSGSKFYKCALQVNPADYAKNYRGKPASDDAVYIPALLKKAQEYGVEVLAITDHNHVGSIEKFRAEAAKLNIHIFPGFEVSSHDGIHVLCLYPTNSTTAQLERHLGAFGIHNTDPSADLSTKSFSEVLALVREQGGIAIAAHVTQDKGLLMSLHGASRIQAWKDPNLLAVQIPGRVEDLPIDKKPIFTNVNPEYRREYVAGENLAVAVINAKDVMEPDDLADPSTNCWIKMSSVSIEGLRQAFLDPTSRIRLNSDPVPDGHTEYVALSWEGGFLDGLKIHFNENLNTLIGGRGTGKSSIVESIRYTLDLKPIGVESATQHEGIIKNVIGAAAKISLLVRSYRPAPREYVIERTVGNRPIVKDQRGALLDLKPCDVVPNAEVFGQHEISEIARSPEKRTVLLTKFIDGDPGRAVLKAKIKVELERSRIQITAARKEVEQIDERLATLPAIEEKIKRYELAGYEKKLAQHNLIAEEQRLLTTAPDSAASFVGIVQELEQLLPIDRTAFSEEALAKLPNKELVAKANDALKAFDVVAQDVLDRLKKGVSALLKQLSASEKDWLTATEKVRGECDKALRQIKGPEGIEYIGLKKQQAEILPLKEKRKVSEKKVKDGEASRRTLLTQWEDVKAEEFRQLQAAAKKVSKTLSNRVRISVTYAGNKSPLTETIKSLGGRTSDIIEVINDAEQFSVDEFIRNCQAGAPELIKQYGLSAAQADRFSKLPVEFIMKLEEIDLPPTSKIELNVASEGQPQVWQQLEHLSTGQKATAILFLLLLETEAPLVVDQPEDDLDNRFIREGVVPTMRDTKRRRQFIFATHNANIPVLGDAELILGLQVVGGKAVIPDDLMASIDSEPVSDLVKDVLEGGKEAFELRRLKYGF